MKIRRLFSVIWRINAVLILCAGALVTLLMAFLATQTFSDLTRKRRVADVAHKNLDEIKVAVEQLGSFESIPGSAWLRAPLLVRETFAFSSGSKEAVSERNYLYFDAVTRATHWLRPDNSGILLRSFALSRESGDGKTGDAIAHVHVSVESDTNGDSRLSGNDAKRVALSSPEGRDLRALADDVDEVKDIRLLPSGNVLLLYAKGDALFSVEVDPHAVTAAVVAHEVAITPLPPR